MTIKELKDKATAILAYNEAGEFSVHEFSTRSGGAPRNKVGIPEIQRSNHFEYPTTANGDAFSGTVSVRARKTGVKDCSGREIYEAENGTAFVFRYRGGSPESFDSGALIAPEMIDLNP